MRVHETSDIAIFIVHKIEFYLPLCDNDKLKQNQKRKKKNVGEFYCCRVKQKCVFSPSNVEPFLKFSIDDVWCGTKCDSNVTITP